MRQETAETEMQTLQEINKEKEQEVHALEELNEHCGYNDEKTIYYNT